MTLMKYFGEQDSPNQSTHNGHLFWSGAMNGLPFRGNQAPMLTQDELTEQVEVHWDFKFHEFDLHDEEDKARYQYVMDRSVNGWFFVHHREHIKDPATGRVRYIYLEWSQRYGQLSPTAPDALRSRGHAISPIPGQSGEPPVRLAGLQNPAIGENG